MSFSINKLITQPHPHHASFVPRASSVVSATVIAQVFDGEAVPFETNADGSVDGRLYAAWLDDAGQQALRAFGECSAPVKAAPRARRARERVATAG